MTAARPILVFIVSLSGLMAAQEVKVIDLSSIEQRTVLRYPPSKPTCDSANSCVVGVGGSGMSVGDGAPDSRDPHALGVSLEHVSTKDVTLDAFDAEFRILNTGLAAVEIPIFPHLSDLQPPDERKSFSYLSLALVINLRGTGSQPESGFGYVELYGAADHEGTTILLQPGQWVRVKSKVKLYAWPSKPVTADLRGDFSLRTSLFTPAEGGGFTQITNLYPNSTSFPPIRVQFTPTHSKDAGVLPAP